MEYFVGIIIGLAVANIVFTAYVYFQLKGKNPIQKGIQKIEEKSRQQVRIFLPPTESEEAMDTIIKRNEKRGRDTEAEELGI